MIDVIFTFGTDLVLVKVKGHDVSFGSSSQGAQLATIDGLKLNYSGVIEEFPDLEGKEDWRQQAIEKFKEKIKSFDSEEKIVEYIIEDLRKFGYIPKYKQKAGFRKEVIQ